MLRTTVLASLLLAVILAPAADAAIVVVPLIETLDAGCADATEEAVDLGVGAASTCTATADCYPYSDVSCSGSSICKSVDKNCSTGTQGYVECDGVKTYCTPCCEDGSIRIVPRGGCCSESLQNAEQQVCEDGEWVHYSDTCMPVPSCPYSS